MNNIKTIEEMNRYIDENEMLVIYFGSNTCGVCHAVKPKLEKMLLKYPKILSVNVDIENLLMSATYNIFTVPAIILYIQGKETIRQARFINSFDLEQKISRYYELYYK